MLRSQGRDLRRGVAGDTRVDAEARLVGHLRSLASPNSAVVGAYVADDGEPDLAPWIDRLRADGATVALPVVGTDRDATMTFRPWPAGRALEPGRWGIRVPAGAGRAVVPDIVVVPIVRFDRHGDRLGRGAGCYDRWLAAHDAAITVGVAFECQRVERLPVEPHDVPLDVIVTELGVRFPRARHGRCPVPVAAFGQDGVRCA